LDIAEVADILDETLWEAYEGDERCSDYARYLMFNKKSKR
jgi:hypothetical protein